MSSLFSVGLVLLGFLLFVPASFSQTITLPTGTSLASRTSGVAPLAVFFDATGTTSTVTTRPFHDLEYRWDFGDAGSGSWSTTGLSRNSATGPVAAHVFESPGTYTVTLTALDGTNTATQNVTITVTDPDTVFSGANTICFSTTGTFSDAPPGFCTQAAQRITTTNFVTALSNAAQGKRLLFRRGETWNAAQAAALAVPGPGIIGAFGSGALPIVRSTATSGDVILQVSAGTTPTISDWRIMDIDFNGQSKPNSVGISADGGFNQLTLLRLTMRDIYYGLAFSSFTINFYNNTPGFSGHTVWDQLAVADSTISRVINGGYGGYISALRFAFLGTIIDDATAGQSNLRVPYMGKGVISNSILTAPGPTKVTLKLHAPCRSGPDCDFLAVEGTNFTENVVISDNKFTGAAGVPWTVAIEPQNSGSNEQIRDVIVERNWFKAVSDTSISLVVAASKITVRNNLFDMTGGNTGRTGVVFTRSGLEPVPDLNYAYNNTFYSASTGTDFIGVRMDFGTNSVIKNNLAYAPNGTSPLMLEDATTTTVKSNNSSDAQVKSTPPGFVSATPTVPADFKLSSGSYAINAGTAVPVFSDYFLTNRPQSSAIDLGFAEYAPAGPDTTPPSIPAGLNITNLAATTLTLNWTASTDAVGVTAYQVLRGGVFRATVNAPTVSFNDTGLTASTAYSYTVRACDAAANCSTASSAALATTLPPEQITFSPVLEAGFNLGSNALNITLNVASIFGNQDSPVAGVTDNVVSVWKWNAVSGRWAFHSPALTAAGIASYAAGRNYDVLSVISAGEGYWVNAINPITLPTQSGAGFTWNGSNFAALPAGFNLIAHAGAVTPSQFNLDVSASIPAPGVIPTDNFVSLWVWDAVAGTWYFYSPLLEASGGLPAVKNYADSHFFRHFQDYNKQIDVGVGFWVSRP